MDDESARALGELLRRRRRELGLNQTQLGRVLGVHYMTISAWERGRPVGGANCQKVARWLNVSVDEVLRLTNRSVQTFETNDEARARVMAERVAQGLPPTIQDPAALARVAKVLRSIRPAR